MDVSIEKIGEVGLVTFANPPVNALSVGGGLVAAMTDVLRQAGRRDDLLALVVQGRDGVFSAGADIADFGDDPAVVTPIRAMIALLDSLEKPVVMALEKLALGGGLEFALGGHFRICTRRTRLGFPEVTLGLLPGAGGTQRLPRLAGAAAALDLIGSGRLIDADQALAISLVDRIAEGDLTSAALAAARDLVGAPLRRVRDLPVDTRGFDATAARETAARSAKLSRAPGHIVECVAAAVGPFDDGLALEYRLFDELMVSEASYGLRHAFFGKRSIGRIPGLPRDAEARPIAKAAVVGAGLMGTGIATALLAAAVPVTLIEPRADALQRAAETIKASFARDVAKKRLDEGQAARCLDRLALSSDIAAAGDADLVIEAVPEDLAIKRAVFTALDRETRPDAILASNTSTLDLDQIAGATRRPERVVGTHFFSPANVMKLLEVVRGARTDLAVLETIRHFAARIGKVPVIAGVCDGFIGNRMFEEYLRQAYFLLEEGALPDQVDRALERWGMAMGPLRTMDLAGQDIGWSIRKRRALEQPDRPYSRIPDLVCEQQRFGQKTGAGFYRYPEGRRAVVDPGIDALVIAHSAAIGLQRRAITDDEIVDRCILALVNEGARILADGIAYRPVDIDIVYLEGYGFPGARGGPMFHADRLGLPAVLDRIRRYAEGRHGWAWTPAPLLVDLVEHGAGFGSLDA